ncbi:MAG: 50S ribosomal protein L20 [Planctomycetota bacterium]|jgi:large subunit ribosomal protein L20
MPRARAGAARHKRKVRILRAARGFRGGRSKLYRTAKEAVTRAHACAYRDRRRRKRDFRALWITRLTAACRARGIQYSRFIFGLQAAGVALNRKMLSEIAISDPAAFDAIVEIAKQHQAKSAA